jgi:hypothetical protein
VMRSGDVVLGSGGKTYVGGQWLRFLCGRFYFC